MTGVSSSTYTTSYDFGTGVVIEWSGSGSKGHFIPWKNVNGIRSPLTIADAIPPEDVEEKSGKFSKMFYDLNSGPETSAPAETYFFRTRGGLLLYFGSPKDVMPVGAIPLLRCCVTLPEDGAEKFSQVVSSDDSQARLGANKILKKYPFEMKLSCESLYCIVLMFPTADTRGEWADYLLRYIGSLTHATVSAKSLYEYAAVIAIAEGGIFVTKKRGKTKARLEGKDHYPTFGGSKKWMYLSWSGPPSSWHLLLSSNQLKTTTAGINVESSGDTKAYPLSDIVMCCENSGAASFCFYLTKGFLFEPYLILPTSHEESKKTQNSAKAWVQAINSACKLQSELIDNADSESDPDSVVGKLHSTDFREKYLFTENNVARRGVKKRSSQRGQLPPLSDILVASPAAVVDGNLVAAAQPKATQSEKTFKLSSMWGKKKDSSAVNGRNRNKHFLPSDDTMSSEDPIASLSVSMNRRKDNSKSTATVESGGNDENSSDGNDSKAKSIDDDGSSTQGKKEHKVFRALGVRKPVRVNGVENPATSNIGADVDPKNFFVAPALDGTTGHSGFNDLELNADSLSRNIACSHYNWLKNENHQNVLMAPEGCQQDIASPDDLTGPTPDLNHMGTVLGSRKDMRSTRGAVSSEEWKNNSARLSDFFGVFSASSQYSSDQLGSNGDIDDEEDNSENGALDNKESQALNADVYVMKAPPLSRGMSRRAQHSRGDLQRITEEANEADDVSCAEKENHDEKQSRNDTEVYKAVPESVAPKKTSLFRSIVNSVVRGNTKVRKETQGNPPIKNDALGLTDDSAAKSGSSDLIDASIQREIIEDDTASSQEKLLNASAGSEFRGNAAGRLASDQSDSSSDDSKENEDEISTTDDALGPMSPHATNEDLGHKGGFFRNFFRSPRHNEAKSPLQAVRPQGEQLIKLPNSNSFGKKRSASLRDCGDLVIPGGDGDVLETKRDTFFSYTATRRASASSLSLGSFASPKSRHPTFEDLKLDNNIEQSEHIAEENENMCCRSVEIPDNKEQGNGEACKVLLKEILLDKFAVSSPHINYTADVDNTDDVSRVGMDISRYNQEDNHQNGIDENISHITVCDDDGGGIATFLLAAKSRAEDGANIQVDPGVACAVEGVVASVNTHDLSSRDGMVAQHADKSAEKVIFSDADARNHNEDTLSILSKKPEELSAPLLQKGILAGLVSTSRVAQGPIILAKNYSAVAYIEAYSDSRTDINDDGIGWISGDVTLPLELEPDAPLSTVKVGRAVSQSVSCKENQECKELPGDSFINDILREYKSTSVPEYIGSSTAEITNSIDPINRQFIANNLIDTVVKPGIDAFVLCDETVSTSGSPHSPFARKMWNVGENVAHKRPLHSSSPSPRARHFTTNPYAIRQNELPDPELLAAGRDFEESEDVAKNKLSRPSRLLSEVGRYLFPVHEKNSSQNHGALNIVLNTPDKSAVAKQRKKDIMELLLVQNEGSQVKPFHMRKNDYRNGVASMPLEKLREKRCVKTAHADEKMARQGSAEITGEQLVGSKLKERDIFPWWDQPPSTESLAHSFSISDLAKSGLGPEQPFPDNVEWKLPNNFVNRGTKNIVQTPSPPHDDVDRLSDRSHSPKRRQSLSSTETSTNNCKTTVTKDSNAVGPSYMPMTLKYYQKAPHVSSLQHEHGRRTLVSSNPAIRRESMRRLQRSEEEENRLTVMRQSLKEKRLHGSVPKENPLEGRTVLSQTQDEDAEYILKAQCGGEPVSLYLGKTEIFVRHNDTGQFSTIPYAGAVYVTFML